MTPSDDRRPLAESIQALIHLRAQMEGRDDLSSQEVANAIRESGGNISHTTIWKLRTGQEKNPRVETLSLLGSYFGVSVKYFFDDRYADNADRQLRLLAAMRDGTLLGVAARFGELSPAGQHTIASVIEQVLHQERGGEGPDGWSER